MIARRDLAFAGGAALAAGLLLGFMADRLRRIGPPSAIRPIPVAHEKDLPPSPMPDGESPAGDVLERFRLVAAV
jgi:hypothetical protein